MPVHRTGTGGSVFANSADLDIWLVQRPEPALQAELDPQPEPAPQPEIDNFSPAVEPSSEPALAAEPTRAVDPARPIESMSKGRWAGLHRFRWAALAIPIACTLVLGGIMLRSGTNTQIEAPIKAQWSKQYYVARSQWAERTPESIAKSIFEYQSIILQDPDAAKAYVGLADAYALSSEFAGFDRPRSFALAKQAVDKALALWPSDPDANRLAGYLSYWTDRDIAKAKPLFEASLATNHENYLAHLWYGNALVDAGLLREGLDHLQRAAVLAPDSPSVQIDYAVAMWQAGNSAESLAMLKRAHAMAPENSAAPSWLALFSLQDGDYAAYLGYSETWATLVKDSAQMARVARETEIYRREGRDGLLKAMAEHAPIPGGYWHGGDLVRAIAGSQLGDRTFLIKLLSQPGIAAQNWRDLRFPVQSHLRWRNDPVLAPLLDRAFGKRDYANYPAAA